MNLLRKAFEMLSNFILLLLVSGSLANHCQKDQCVKFPTSPEKPSRQDLNGQWQVTNRNGSEYKLHVITGVTSVYYQCQFRSL